MAQPLAFAFTLRADGTAGSLIGIGSNNFIIAGTLQRQDTTAFSLAALVTASSSFAFEIDSDVPTRNSTIGRFTIGSSGVSTSGLYDISVAGSGPTTMGGPLSVMFSAGGPDANGKGSMSLSENGATTNYVYFIINAGKFIVMQTDTNVPNTLGIGVAERQSLPFSAATVDTAGSVLALTGFDSTLANDVVTVGRLQVGTSNTATLLWDTNDDGNVFSQKTLAEVSITFDANTGRGSILSGGGSSNGSVPIPVEK